MNLPTAENLLRTYRAGLPSDARIQKALQLVEQDPQFKKSFADQTEFDAQIYEVVQCVALPDDFGAKLQALAPADASAVPKLRKQMVNPAMLSAVAGLLLILGVVIFLFVGREEIFPGRDALDRILATTTKVSEVDLEPVNMTAGQLGDWLYMRGYDGYVTPKELVGTSVLFSRVFPVEGKKVVQFAIDHRDALVFQFHASDFGVHLPKSEDWQVFTSENWVAAAWQQENACVMIAFRGSDSEMHDLLQTLPAK